MYRPLQFQKRRQFFVRTRASARHYQTHRELVSRLFRFQKCCQDLSRESGFETHEHKGDFKEW